MTQAEEFYQAHLEVDDNNVPADTEWMLEQWKSDERGNLVLQTDEVKLYWNRIWAAIAVGSLYGEVLIMDPTREQVRKLTEILGD